MKLSFPEIVRAVTISGLATKDSVAAFPSFLFAKFLLNDVIIVFFSPSLTIKTWNGPSLTKRDLFLSSSLFNDSVTILSKISLNCFRSKTGSPSFINFGRARKGDFISQRPGA